MEDNDDTPIKFRDANETLKHVFRTIRKKCDIEASCNIPIVALNDPESRIELYTGLPISYINNFSDKPNISRLDLHSQILILETVKNMYMEEQQQTYDTLFEEANKNGGLKFTDGSKVTPLESLVQEMEKLGFQWKTTAQNKDIIMEDPAIRFERYVYLSRIKKIRSNPSQWNIVYVDERLVGLNKQQFQKPWLLNKTFDITESFTECVFYHAVSKKGLVTGMFSNQVSESDFAKWFIDILLMHFKTPTVIIMDSNPLHGSLEKVSSITRYHSKIDMLRWLTNNDVPCNSNMSKPALFELIKKSNEDQLDYRVDRIVRSHGHEVLRLPRHLYDMSLTTAFWDNIHNFDIDKVGTLTLLQNLLMDIMNQIQEDKWAEYEHTIELHEKDLFNIDMTIEKLSDNFDIKLS